MTSGGSSRISFTDECKSNHLSVTAVDEVTGRIGGAFINRDFLQPPPPGFMTFVDDPSPFAPIVQALFQIDNAWLAHHPEVKPDDVGRVADLWMLGAHADLTGRGIASRLASLSLERVREPGFEYAIVECTGAYSQRIMEAAECDVVQELPYGELLWKGGPVFKTIAPPHTKWDIYEKHLQQVPSRC